MMGKERAQHRVPMIAWSVLIMGSLGASVQGATVFLDGAHQGQGPKGSSFRPIDEFGGAAIFQLTAHSLVDPTQPHNPTAPWSVEGIVYIKDGAGVQDNGGSIEISGLGGSANEDLVFTFDNPISIDAVILGFDRLDFGNGPLDKDDPAIFLSDANNPGTWHTIQEAEILANFTSTGGPRGLVDFSGFTTAPAGLVIDSMMVRETNGHMVVSSFVPEPTSLCLLVLGGLLVTRRRG